MLRPKSHLHTLRKRVPSTTSCKNMTFLSGRCQGKRITNEFKKIRSTILTRTRYNNKTIFGTDKRTSFFL